ncbi:MULTISPECIES: peptide-methionine (S)-S-oxide reductase [Staphylococcus]|uniref:Peptide methionine sulfoxide reductase MsrA n=1 Tax=Staphylococcus hsinchuensis TaxID=3051183 RepID=A0ABZ3EES5_9STAP|nr:MULTISPECIES: peptide-methionine (S)-S-oxide reductase [unclassified Staphylococcus]
METVYLAGGCLWGVQAFINTLPGVIETEAGRANGDTNTLDGEYDGYAECVKTTYDPHQVSVSDLMNYLFEIIDPYAVNHQGEDVGPKYRTGFYSEDASHLEVAQAFINERNDKERIMVEVKPLSNYVKSADIHQNHLEKYPNDYCHIPPILMNKYK